MAKLFPTITILAILATHAATGALLPGHDDCDKAATEGKCKHEFVNGALKNGRVVKRCCGVMRDVGKDCFLQILNDFMHSTTDQVNWDGFWSNSTSILSQCQVSP